LLEVFSILINEHGSLVWKYFLQVDDVF